MGVISLKSKGSFKKTKGYLKRVRSINYDGILDKYGKIGVKLLEDATPVDTGETAKSWYYTITESKNAVSLNFCNSNIQNGVPIALVLHYGHATQQGTWVEGIDYINPTLKPMFEDLVSEMWKEVKA